MRGAIKIPLAAVNAQFVILTPSEQIARCVPKRQLAPTDVILSERVEGPTRTKFMRIVAEQRRSLLFGCKDRLQLRTMLGAGCPRSL